MRKENFFATKLNVSFKDQNKDKWGGESHFDPAKDDHTLLRHMLSLYAQCLERSQAKRIRHVYITLHGLVDESSVIDNILIPTPKRCARNRLSKLSDVIDQTNEKYQSNIVTVGLQEQPPGDYAGGKIAFGRIPDAMSYLKRVQARDEDNNRSA